MDHPTREEQIEALKKVQKLIDIYVERMGLKDVTALTLKTKIEDDGYSDPMLYVGETASACYCNLVCSISPSIADERGYVLGHMVYNPGVRYYPDGSGEPPSEDFVEDGDTSRPGQAAMELLTLAFAIELQMAAESYDEDQLAREEKEFYEREESESILDG